MQLTEMQNTRPRRKQKRVLQNAAQDIIFAPNVISSTFTEGTLSLRVISQLQNQMESPRSAW